MGDNKKYRVVEVKEIADKTRHAGNKRNVYREYKRLSL